MSRELLGTSAPVYGRKPRIEKVRIADRVEIDWRGAIGVRALVVDVDIEKRELLVKLEPGQRIPRGFDEVTVVWRQVKGWRSSQLGLFEAPAQSASAIHV